MMNVKFDHSKRKIIRPYRLSVWFPFVWSRRKRLRNTAKLNRCTDSIRASFNDKRTERKEIPGNRDPDSCNICRSFRHFACKFNDSAHRRTRSAFLTGPSKRFPTCKSASRGAHQRFSRVPTSILELITTRAWADEPDSLARLRKNPDNSRLAHEHRIAYEKPESLWLNECVTPSLARSLLRGSFTCGWSRCFFFFFSFFFSLSVFRHSVFVVYTRALLMSAGGRELAKRSYKKFFHCTRVNPCVYAYFSRVCSMVKTIYTGSRKHLNGLP